MKSVIVIPARLASTRLPRKLLLRETGKSLLQHTYESAAQSLRASEVIVAVDDAELEQEVLSFGGQAVLTDPDHVCGTDRVAEVARELDADLIINVQGDEPEITYEDVDTTIIPPRPRLYGLVGAEVIDEVWKSRQAAPADEKSVTV